MEATYCMGNDIDVCRMFDQYLYKKNDDLDLSVAMSSHGSHHNSSFNSSNEQTFHTPSFGDEEFDIPSISVNNSVAPPPAHLSSNAYQHSSMSLASLTNSAQLCNSGNYRHYVTNANNMGLSVSTGYGGSVYTSVASNTSPHLMMLQHAQQQAREQHMQQQQQQQQQQHYTLLQSYSSPPSSGTCSTPNTVTTNSDDSDDSAATIRCGGNNNNNNTIEQHKQQQQQQQQQQHQQHQQMQQTMNARYSPQVATLPGMKRTSPDPIINDDLCHIQKKPKPTKKKKKRDPNEPQKPVSAYALFFRDTQAQIKGKNPNTTFGEVSKIVASMWDGLDAEFKDIYKKKTEMAKKAYLKDLAAYRANHLSNKTEVNEGGYHPSGYGNYTTPSSYNGYSPPGNLPSPPVGSPLSSKPPVGMNSDAVSRNIMNSSNWTHKHNDSLSGIPAYLNQTSHMEQSRISPASLAQQMNNNFVQQGNTWRHLTTSGGNLESMGNVKNGISNSSAPPTAQSPISTYQQMYNNYYQI